ncbi:T9SS type A sorting domain-containing protein [Pontibacter sp. G13]|uniref:T9SS type A sorting domain-containing protein n=1 Tax=Pontibacter sp. G13 TaxID=3074898 RepID=UPI00288C34CA|nr:T9SS type A sorting domain-containing protein [Pontibacter sp. G13]WNJ18919.1 T9SS type A sorting domain-containing protein [Pontibacter sp. G13]
MNHLYTLAKSFCLTAAVAISQVLVAQPTNDTPCNATLVTVNGATVTASNVGATADPGESNLAPPQGFGQDYSTWYFQETDIQNSIWFKFAVPASGAVEIDLCDAGTTFDTQIALFLAANCGDYNTYLRIGANDDNPSCANGGLLSYGIWGCLNPGDTALLLVDGYNADTGSVAVSISEFVPTAVSATVTTKDADCSGTGGGATVSNIQGGVPGGYSIFWNNTTTEESNGPLAPGNYTVTVFDICSNSTSYNVTIGTETSSPLAVDAGLPAVSACSNAQLVLGGTPTASGGTPIVENRAFGIDLNGDGNGTNLLYTSRLNNQYVSKDMVFLPNHDSPYSGDFVGSQFMFINSDGASSQLIAVDTLTKIPTALATIDPGADRYWGGMSFDPVSQSVYALSVGQNDITLHVIDPGTGFATQLSTLTGNVTTPSWLAINNTGQMFTLDDTEDAIYLIDPGSGATALIGSVGFDAEFVQDADFDPETNLLYLAAFNNDAGQAELRVADLSTGATTLVDPAYNVFQIGAFGIAPASAPAYTFAWSPSTGLDDAAIANPTMITPTAGTYSVLATDLCGAFASDQVTVTLADAPMVAVSGVWNSATNTGSAAAAVTGGTPPFTYNWNTGATTQAVSNLPAGFYTVSVRDANGCETVGEIIINESTSINAKLAGITHFSAYPNPAQDQFTLELELDRMQQVQVSLMDLKGRQVFGRVFSNVQNLNEIIELGHVSAGLYLLNITTESGRSVSKITIQ